MLPSQKANQTICLKLLIWLYMRLIPAERALIRKIKKILNQKIKNKNHVKTSVDPKLRLDVEFD